MDSMNPLQAHLRILSDEVNGYSAGMLQTQEKNEKSGGKVLGENGR